MKKLLKKALCICLILTFLSSGAPWLSLVNASDGAKIQTLTIIRHWSNSSKVWQTWQDKPLGVYTTGGVNLIRKAQEGQADPVTLASEYAAKFSLQSTDSSVAIKISSKSHRTDDPGIWNLPVEYEKAYFEFDFYTNTTNTANLPTRIFMGGKTVINGSTGWPNVIYDMTKYQEEIKLGEWNHIVVPFDEFAISSGVEWNKLAAIDNLRLDFPASLTENFDVYLCNMYFTVDRPVTTCEFKNAGMNENGQSYVDLSFSRPLNDQSIVAQEFLIDGFNCISAVCDATDKTKLRLTFDNQFDFPKEYTLTLSSNLKDSETYLVSNAAVNFKTSDFHDEVLVNSLTIDKTNILSGMVTCNANISKIYDNINDTSGVKMLVMAYSGDELITSNESETVVIAKGTPTPLSSVELNSEKITAESEIIVFLVSAKDGIRPLCKCLSENK